MEKNKMNAWPVFYFIFGMYFLNFGIEYFSLPELFLQMNKWIIFVGGMLFFVAFFRSVMYSKKRILRRALKH